MDHATMKARCAPGTGSPGGGALDGYPVSVPYPTQFGVEMTPGFLAGAAAIAGIRPPPSADSFRLLDIGCGNGLAAAVVAASHPTALCEGIDGNPQHIAEGRRRAGSVGNLTLSCQTFAEALDAGGEVCDFVVCNGVIAWVVPEVRAQVFELAAARLAPGGLFALGYNVMPGWASRLAFQRLVRQFADQAGASVADAFPEAFARVRDLALAGLVDAVPADLVGALDNQFGATSTGYLVHEYLAPAFSPLWSADVIEQLACQGLSFVGAARFDHLRPDLTLHASQQEALASEPDQGRRASLGDIMTNATYRIDLFAKEPVRDRSARDQMWLAAEGCDVASGASKIAGRSLLADSPTAAWVLAALQDGPVRLDGLKGWASASPARVDDAVDRLLIERLIRPTAPKRDPSRNDLRSLIEFNSLAAAAARGPHPMIRALAGTAGPAATSVREIRAWAAGDLSERLRRLGVPPLDDSGEGAPAESR